MNRLPQFVLVVSTLLGSWLGMQAVHELGHIVAAQVTGGHVSRVVLHPLTISRTDLSSNPHPLIVVWSGPFVGALLPLGLWGLAVGLRLPTAFVLRFFAGFCLIANGLYISVGSIDNIGDCGEMLRHGAQPWHLWLFGALTVPIGFRLWHDQGSDFGFGLAGRSVSRRLAAGVFMTFVALFVAGLIVDGG